jgi:hypothetical protein
MIACDVRHKLRVSGDTDFHRHERFNVTVHIRVGTTGGI